MRHILNYYKVISVKHLTELISWLVYNGLQRRATWQPVSDADAIKASLPDSVSPSGQ